MFQTTNQSIYDLPEASLSFYLKNLAVGPCLFLFLRFDQHWNDLRVWRGTNAKYRHSSQSPLFILMPIYPLLLDLLRAFKSDNCSYISRSAWIKGWTLYRLFWSATSCQNQALGFPWFSSVQESKSSPPFPLATRLHPIQVQPWV